MELLFCLGCLGDGYKEEQKSSIVRTLIFLCGRGDARKKCDIEEVELLVVVARKIWFRRNAVVHREDFIHPNHVFREAVDSLDEFREVNSKEDEGAEDKQEVVQLKWKNPPTGMIKANWDVAMDKIKGSIGFGNIVRDFEGFVLATQMTEHNKKYISRVGRSRILGSVTCSRVY